MLVDIWTMLRKELNEYLIQGGVRSKRSYLIYILIFGIFLPLQSGAEGIRNGLPLLFFAWLPFLLVSGIIADSFAGERERHTLETLLATRLPDQAILFGKILAATLYGTGMVLVCLITSIVAANVAFRGEGFVSYPPLALAGALVGCLLAAGLASGIGVLVSLRAPTARQAQQTMSIAIIALFLPFYILPLLPPGLLPPIPVEPEAINIVAILLAVGSGLLVLDIVLILVARLRFKREQLILD
ncbi:MAG: ABC transporter permease [Anaerolineae bacterium]|nr:ABC transporter permease [Anaerolineae bacterium]